MVSAFPPRKYLVLYSNKYSSQHLHTAPLYLYECQLHACRDTGHTFGPPETLQWQVLCPKLPLTSATLNLALAGAIALLGALSVQPGNKAFSAFITSIASHNQLLYRENFVSLTFQVGSPPHTHLTTLLLA